MDWPVHDFAIKKDAAVGGWEADVRPVHPCGLNGAGEEWLRGRHAGPKANNEPTCARSFSVCLSAKPAKNTSGLGQNGPTFFGFALAVGQPIMPIFLWKAKQYFID